MPRAYTGQAAGNDLAALGDKTLQQANIAVGDSVDLLGAELANFLAPEKLASTRTASGTTSRTWCAGTGAGAGMPARAGCRCVLLSRLCAVSFHQP